jgi:hypothetical protein
MTGQRSLAEMYANEVLSDVEDGAVDVRLAYFLGMKLLTGFRIVLHFADINKPARGGIGEIYMLLSTRF